VFPFIEALSDGGVASGLPRDVATKLAAQTVLGSAAMVKQSGLCACVRRDMVANSGDAGSAGLEELRKGKLRSTLIRAVCAASNKSKQLGQT
jgi:pyrroline-5-carboxylate reductase